MGDQEWAKISAKIMRHLFYLNSKETSLKSEKKYKSHRQAEYHHALKGRKTLLSAVHMTRFWVLSFMKCVCYQ